ncbi:hypothetical protein KC367_g4768 [Hortaea werneckii]|nr:hypothetical protein KC342_g5852 [Hortaea werneckii]KAI7099933.1 hypothetical protein KC339_g7838 [Hortaea werneckii]KAI7217592.1 hypothetical protein KC365_g12889 [Hortaea werneckii]KAI7312819.1 hypothetical protein KC340_g9734 [Hortaea werneckii]KAI7347795.1 hypothetical protein KC354_g13818 [Hortaea werneckii]
MALVAYSDSSDTDKEDAQPTKKRKVSDGAKSKTALPPLPSTFQDLYSSTVRTSTQDDPSLHGGRRRVTPHIEGNWPTHVYLEWRPNPEEAQLLAGLIAAQYAHDKVASEQSKIHSLLQNDLGVSLPLHVSLSRPLVLRTEQKDPFLDRLRNVILASGVHIFTVKPNGLRWHSNESNSRYFLVLGLERTQKAEMSSLLTACNRVAKDFDQPLLYAEDANIAKGKRKDAKPPAPAEAKCHISIAWSLEAPPSSQTGEDIPIPSAIAELDIPFSEIKVRIGQDVTAVPLPAARKKGALF